MNADRAIVQAQQGAPSAPLAQVEMDPRILMAAKVIQTMSGRDNDGNYKIGDEMAIACGRDNAVR